MSEYGTYQTSQGLGFAQITALSTVKALAPPGGATVAIVQAETQNVRWRDDNVAPTASVGMLLSAGSSGTFSGGDLTRIKFIEVTPSAVLNVSYY